MEGWAWESEFSFFFPSLNLVFEQEFPSSKYSQPMLCADKISSPDMRNSVMHQTLQHSRKSTSCDKFALTCMPTSIEIVREEETSIPSILASTYPKKNPEAWRQHTESTTCNPDERIAEAFWAIALPHKIATVATATNGIKGDTNSTRPLQYWFKMAPSRTGASTTCSHNHYGRVWIEETDPVTCLANFYKKCCLSKAIKGSTNKYFIKFISTASSCSESSA